LNKSESKEHRLEKEGWSKRFVASEPRLGEAVEMYHKAGYEVRIEPLPKGTECDSCVGTEEDDDCRICFEGAEDMYKTIFTRAKENKTESEDDLF
jgi:hypothetical protein